MRNQSSPTPATFREPDECCPCPFLGTWDDPGTAFAYPSGGNFCHREKPPQSVPLPYQTRACFTQEYARCPAYTGVWTGNKKPDRSLRDEMSLVLTKRPARWGSAAFVVILLLLFALAGSFFLPGMFHRQPKTDNPATQIALQAALFATETASALEALPTSTSTPPPSLTPLPPTATPAPTSTPTPLPTSTSTPTPVTPTPGPAPETPFGPQGAYLLHIVREGESLSTLAEKYGTTLKVLRDSNVFSLGVSLWPGKVVFIPVGKKDLNGIIQVHVIQVEADTNLPDLALAYHVSLRTLSELNEIGLEDRVERGRWLLIPAEKETP